jgi:superfamily II DNA or RNA helicase
VFSVEVLGEGVDVPDVDTLLLLRPTASVTVFTQQLGRGLRRAVGKSHLTVIDLIGQHRREFSFAERFSAIMRRDRQPIEAQVREGFPFLPAGCTVDLDKTSEEIVLENLKAAVQRTRWQTLFSICERTSSSTRLQRSSMRQATASRMSTSKDAVGQSCSATPAARSRSATAPSLRRGASTRSGGSRTSTIASALRFIARSCRDRAHQRSTAWMSGKGGS